MNDQFDWFVGEEDEAFVPPRAGASRWLTRPLWFLLVTAVLTTALLTGWLITQKRLERAKTETATAVQALLDLEHDAFQNGDGDLYFSFFGSDANWVATQLQPVNLQAARAGYRVTRAEAHDNFIWANLAWTPTPSATQPTDLPTEQQTYQRIAFFQRQDGQLTHARTAPDYWGSWISYEEPWGELIFTERDELWADAVAHFVTETTAEICSPRCPPFTLHLANDYHDTAVPDQLRIPSPRLIALDEDGQPADLFWEMLRQRIIARLNPVTIRFAVPEPDIPGIYLVDYQQAAADFMALHPDITIELVTLDIPAGQPGRQLQQFDGAAFNPTADLIAAGQVYDLTNLAATDPAFAQGDFYDQIWQGVWWNGRMWAMPLAAEMKLIYYEKEAFRMAGLSQPSLRWTWKEMEQYLAALDEAQIYSSAWRQYLFFDGGRDALFSYAYNWRNPCPDAIPADCHQPIPPENAAAALGWYRQMVTQPHYMADVVSLSPEERAQSPYRLWAAIRVDEPVFYEHWSQVTGPLGVVPFPGSERFDGVTPLWVEGAFISQHSAHPHAVWEWLKFLSYQAPSPRFRLIPARPSIAQQTNYWNALPRPLSEAMRAAFPFARPVTLADQVYFSWDQLTAVLTNQLTPTEAARRPTPITWFTAP